MNRIEMKLAGYTNKLLVCDGVAACGSLMGPSFFFSDADGKFHGSWVVDAADFLRLVNEVVPSLSTDKLAQLKARLDSLEVTDAER